jgi:hypothetical protein
VKLRRKKGKKRNEKKRKKLCLSEISRDAQDRLLWTDKTYPACT